MSTPAAAETFVLTNGKVVEGTVLRSLGKTLTIKLAGSGMRQLPLEDIERVEIQTENADLLSGRLVRWSNGVYGLATNDELSEVSVQDGRATLLDSVDNRTTATAEPAPTTIEEPRPREMRAGFVYVGTIDDAGWTYGQEQGRLAMAELSTVASTSVATVNLHDDGQIRTAIEALIDEGNNMIVMANHGSPDIMVDAASVHPNVTFIGCGDIQPTPNIALYCASMHEARYLTGVIAGAMTETNILGYVAALPEPQVISDINAFALGAQAVNASVKVIVDWTDAWYAPGVEQEKAAGLLDQGADVLTISQDSPAALQLVEQRGKFAIGYQRDMSPFAPTTTVTSAILDWERMYGHVVDDLEQAGSYIAPRWLGLNEGVVSLAPISSRVPPDLAEMIERLRRELIEGRRHVFAGPIRDSEGDQRVDPGKVMPNSRLLTMDFLVDGVFGVSDFESSELGASQR